MVRAILLVLIWGLTLHAENFTFSRAEIQEIKESAEFVLQKYPPAAYQYVFIGRSLTPVAAMLENMGVNDITQLPLSSMRNFFERNSPEGESALFEHFERFLPTAGSKNNRVLLFLDLTYKGKTFLQQKQILQKYLDTKRPNNQARFLAFMLNDAIDAAVQLRKIGVDTFGVPHTDKIPYLESFGQRFLDGLNLSAYDEWALYDSYVPWQDQGKVFAARPEYATLRTELFAHLKNEVAHGCAAIFN